MDALEQEMQRRGLIPPQQDQDPLLAEMQRRGLNTEEPEAKRRTTWQRAQDSSANATKMISDAKQAFQGNAEFKDAGSFESDMWSQPYFGLNNPDNWKTTAAGMFGSDEDKVKSYFKNNPDVEKQTDKNGNVYYEREGEKIYVDKPGADIGDIGDIAGEAGSYMIGGALAAPIKNAAGRAVVSGSAMYGTDLINQKLAGNEELDHGRAGIVGLSTTAMETALPIIKKVSRFFKNRGANNVQIGQKVAGELGMDGLTKSQLDDLGKYTSQLDDKIISKENIASHVELNQKPTLGTLTKNQGILDTEKQLREGGTKSTINKLTSLDDQNAQGLEEAFQKFGSKIGGGGDANKFDSSSKLLASLQGAKKTADKAVGQAYDDIGEASLRLNTLKTAPERISKALRADNTILGDTITPNARAAVDDIFTKLGNLPDNPNMKVKWQVIDAQRKALLKLKNGAVSNDKHAMNVINKEFDNIIDDAFTNDLVKGSDILAPENLKKARQLAHETFVKFGKEDKYDTGGALIEKLLSKNATPEQLSDAIINVNGLISQNAPQMAKKMINVFGKDSAEHGMLKQMTITGLVDRNDVAKTRSSLLTALRNAVGGKKSYLNEVFDKKEIGFLSRSMHFLEDTELKGVAGRSSGTTERIVRWMNKSQNDDMSLSGMINLIKKGITTATGTGNRRLTALPYKQINSDTARATTADLTANYSNQ